MLTYSITAIKRPRPSYVCLNTVVRILFDNLAVGHLHLIFMAENFNRHHCIFPPNSERVEVTTHITSPISPSAQLHSGFRAESCGRKPRVSHERCISDTFHTYKAIAQGYLLFRQKEGCYPAELASSNINANSFYTQNSGKHSPFHLERSAIPLKCRADCVGKCIRCSRKLGFT